MNFSTKKWSSILCCLLMTVFFIGQSQGQSTRTINEDDFGLVTVNDNSFFKKAENSSPPNPNQLLINVNTTEICNNGIDDDGDGLIDCQDCADCANAANCTDTDSDGIPDDCDDDDDNDGITDEDEGFACEPIGGTVFPPYNYQNCSNSSGGKLFTNIGTYNGQAIDLLATKSGSGSFICGNTGNLGCSSGDNGFTYNDAASSTTLTFTFYLSGTTTPVTINWSLNLDDFDNPEGVEIPNSATYSYQLNPLNNTTITDFGSFTRFESNDNDEDEISFYFYDITSLTIGFKNDTKRNFCFNSSVGFTIPNSSCTITERDTDNDGIPDNRDLDSDNDGCPDAIEGGGNFTNSNLQNNRLTGGVDGNGIPTVANGGQTVGSSQNVSTNVCCTIGTDTDSDGISDVCDLDDDNDGILDIDECPQPTSSGLTGHITNFTTNISSSNPASEAVPHTLNSITYGGTTYSDFILPDAFQSFYTLTDIPNGPRFVENGTYSVFDYSNPNYDQDIIQAYQSRNLNAYQSLDHNNFADGDYYELSYNSPIIATAGGFLAVTERLGNNPQVIQALDINGNIVGNTLTVQTSHYVDLGHNVHHGAGTQNCNMALYPIEDLAPLGTAIYGLRISFGASATGDGPDGKVFFFGDLALAQCDFDGDGIPNNLDLDSDNDGCPDAIEGGGNFTNSNLQNNRLTGGVDGNGIPTVANGGQTVGSSQNVSTNVCCTIGTDTDSDGISDVCDLDDDNDGILDEEENCSPVPVDFSGLIPLTAGSGSQTFTQDINGNTLSSNLTVSAPYVVSGSPSSFGVNVTGVSQPESIKFIDDNGANAGDAFGTQITFASPEQVYISANNAISGSRLTLLDNFTFTPTGTVSAGFRWLVLSSANATITNSGNSITVEGVTPGGSQPFAEFVIVPNEPIAGIEIVYENNANASINSALFNFSYCSADEDGDGVVNRLDLDSDDDGCPDALEGDGNISAANIINNRIGGSIDGNGVPDLANDGQGAGASYDATLTLGCDEICNDGQDNDGDGFIDCADSDCAPILSNVAITQPTCANKTDGQIVVTASSSSALEYSITNEPSWQNSNTFSNLGVGQYTVRVRNASGCTTEYTSNPVILDFETCLEICDDGIDNDGDGLVDCDDPDCKNFGNTNIINND